MSTSVSVVICCHNGAERLPTTLRHLVQQEHVRDISWEVVVIDNASTDNSAAVAEACWPAQSGVPLRVIREERMGLSHARRRGMQEAQYDLISFVDDDNWVAANWVATVSEVMSRFPDVGACGGDSVAVFDGTEPEWFRDVEVYFAVGRQGNASGYICDLPAFLWGAGLSFRKSALETLFDAGFKSLLTDRVGQSLSSGGDSELCLALTLAGWRLYYDQRLVLRHFMPKGRLNKAYVIDLHKALGASSVVLYAYMYLIREDIHLNLRSRLIPYWSAEILIVGAGLVAAAVKFAIGACDSFAFRRSAALKIGRAAMLIKSVPHYRAINAELRKLKQSLLARSCSGATEGPGGARNTANRRD